MESNPHVVVIGAGVTGALVSYKALQAGCHVTCVEARSIGAGSSSRSAACVRAQWGTEANVRAMRRSIRFYKKLPKLLGCPHVQMIRQNGYLYVCATDEEMAVRRELYLLQRNAGLQEVELLDGEETCKRFSHINRDIRGATFCSIDEFCIPANIYGEVFDYCKLDPDFELLVNAPVIRVKCEASRVVSVITPSDEIEGDLLVNANNAWAPRVARLFHEEGEREYGQLPISPEKRFLHFLRVGDSWPQKEFRALPMTVFPTGAYCRPDNAHLLIGWEEETSADPNFSYEDQDLISSGYGHVGENSHGFRTWAEIARWSEKIANLPGMERTTSGYYGVTPDRHHIIDYDRVVDNLIHVAGCSGHGIMSAPFNADAVLHLISVGKGGSRTMNLEDGAFDLLPFALDPTKRLGVVDPTHL